MQKSFRNLLNYPIKYEPSLPNTPTFANLHIFYQLNAASNSNIIASKAALTPFILEKAAEQILQMLITITSSKVYAYKYKDAKSPFLEKGM